MDEVESERIFNRFSDYLAEVVALDYITNEKELHDKLEEFSKFFAHIIARLSIYETLLEHFSGASNQQLSEFVNRYTSFEDSNEVQEFMKMIGGKQS